MSNKEGDVQKAIVEFLKIKGHYCQRLNSGTIMASYNGKKRAIKLCDEGTPDIVACIKSLYITIEVKNGEKEIAKWKRVTGKFQKDSYVPHSYRREISQYKEMVKIRKSGGITILTGSLDDFIKDYEFLISKINSQYGDTDCLLKLE